MTEQTKKAPTKEQQNKLDEMTTKSAKIRYLTSLDWERGEIARFLGIKYQHVRNVQVVPVKNPK